MRTQIRLLATSTFLLGLTAAAALGEPAVTAGPALALAIADDVPETRLVQVGSVPAAGGMARYVVFQRAGARQARGPERDVVISANDADRICEQLEKDGWEEICTLAISVVDPGAVAPAPAAASATSPAASESEAPLALAIAPLRANPVSGRSLVVDVALPGAGAARLEMLDVMGRVIAERDLGSLGAGRHSVNLSAGLPKFAPGVYLLLLTRAGEAKVARVTVID